MGLDPEQNLGNARDLTRNSVEWLMHGLGWGT